MKDNEKKEIAEFDRFWDLAEEDYDWEEDSPEYQELTETDGEPVSGKRKGKAVRRRSVYSDLFWRNAEKVVREKKVNWKDIAEKTGVHRTTIASMRTRKSRLRLDTAMRIAECLKVSVGSLLGESETGSSQPYFPAFYIDEYAILSEYRKLCNRNPDDAQMAQKIIVGILKEYNRKPAADS